LLYFVAGLAIMFLTIHSGRAVFFHTHLAYYVALAATAAWGVCLVRRCRAVNFKEAARRNATVVVTALVATLMVFGTVKPTLRVLGDEANLISTSRNMFIQKKADQIGSSTRNNGEFKIWHHNPPSRPVLFPFFLSLVHAVKGYDYRNVFILNFLCLFALLCGIGVWIRRVCGPHAAFAAIVLIVSQPIVSLVSTSGHYDVFFVLFMFICLATLYDYLKTPSRDAFDLLWMSVILLSLIRNESLVCSAIIMALLVFFRRLDIRHLGSSPVVACTPIFILPLVWHFAPAFQNYVSIAPKHQPFALTYFVEHNKNFFLDQLRFGLVPPFAKVINLIGWISGACALFFLVWRWKAITRAAREAIVIFGIAVLGRWVIITSSWWAGYNDPASYRFYLLPTVILSVSAALGLHLLLRRRPAALIAFVLACLVVYHPIAVNQSRSWTKNIWKEHRMVADYLNQRADQDFILISRQPNKYTVYNFGSISFGSAKASKQSWLRQKRSRVFNEILVLQTISYRTMKPTPDQSLEKYYKLTTIYEKQVDPNYFIRISRVTD